MPIPPILICIVTGNRIEYDCFREYTVGCKSYCTSRFHDEVDFNKTMTLFICAVLLGGVCHVCFLTALNIGFEQLPFILHEITYSSGERARFRPGLGRIGGH